MKSIQNVLQVGPIINTIYVTMTRLLRTEGDYPINFKQLFDMIFFTEGILQQKFLLRHF